MRVAWILLQFVLTCFAVKVAPPLDITSITAQNFTTLENNTTPFGVQDAFTSTYGNSRGIMTLFQNACTQHDGTQNCTAACLNRTQLFSNLETLHNCALYPKISVHMANNSLTTGALHLAEELKIESSNASFLPSFISNTIQNCLLNSCESNTDCSGTLDATHDSDREYNPDNFTYFELCRPIPAYVNADVGGIGVFISYVMQMGLALLAFILAVPWTKIARTIYNVTTTCLSALSVRRGSSTAKPRVKESFAKSHREYPEALATALVGFQKAQCFFMLATNIAGIVVQEDGGLAPESLQQLYNTYNFIKVIAIGGYLPITFTLLTLHMIEQLSWYVLTLSIVTIGVAATTLTIKSSAFIPTQGDLQQIIGAASQGGPPSCAEQNLIPWCYNARKNGHYVGFNSSSSADGARDILIFCLVTLVLLVVDHFCRSDDNMQRKINRFILMKLGIAIDKPLVPHAGTVLRFGTHAFHFIFFWMYIYCFYIFGEDLDWFSEYDIYDPSWGFGQIVAILVWVPTLCDYLWDQMRGTEKGFEHRLSRQYEVIKRDAPRAERTEDDATTAAIGFAKQEDGYMMDGEPV